MGLIKAMKSAVSSVAADQWKEFFYCDALDNEVLASKARKRVNGGRGSNTKGDDNIISNGSVVAVNEGQCMIIVDQGKVVEFCAEAGEFVYDTSSEPSLFCGSFGESLADTFETIGKRFTFGGDTAKDQRVYFFNTKEIMGNKYGTSSPVPFRVVDANIGLDIDITLRCNGEYSYRITDPLLFYKNVCGNISGDFMKSEIESQLKTELLSALQPAFARISELGVRYSLIPKHTTELMNILNEELSAKWSGLRGISIVSFGMNSVKAPEEDEAMIKELQRTAVYRNPNMAAATLVNAQADAMRAAASNTAAGPVMAFAGMNMANAAGGMNANALFAMGQQQGAGTPQMQQNSTAGQQPGGMAGQPGGQGNAAGWVCSCGQVNKGKFCSECGQKKPAGEALYRCDKCGWEPEDPKNPPKFCPECGDPFNDSDIR